MKRNGLLQRAGIPSAKPGAPNCRNVRCSVKRLRKYIRRLRTISQHAKTPFAVLDEIARKLM